MEIGLQLWTMKRNLQENFEGTLDIVAETGFNFLEIADYDLKSHTFHGYSPQTLRRMIEQRGMKLRGAHCVFEEADTDVVCNDLGLAGIDWFVNPFIPDFKRQTIDDYKRAAEEFNRVAEKAKQYALRFGYHSHAFEFAEKEGRIPFEILLDATDPSSVFFEMDLGWMVYAKQEPLKYFKKYPGRFPLWHIRDIDNTGTSVAIGDGVADFKPVFKNRNVAGFNHAIVEISSNEPHAIVNIGRSYRYLKANWTQLMDLP